MYVCSYMISDNTRSMLCMCGCAAFPFAGTFEFWQYTGGTLVVAVEATNVHSW